jgi:hypothetical protein
VCGCLGSRHRFPDQPRARQLLGAVAGPIVFGLVSGLTLGWSAAAYWVFQAVAAVGGVGAGFDHRGARPGAGRGLVGGLLYGGTTLVVSSLTAADDEVDLGNPVVWLLGVVVISVVLGLLGGFLRGRFDPGDHVLDG